MTALFAVLCVVPVTVLWWAVRVWRIVTLVEVSGSSMSPDFEHGDRVLIVRRGAFVRLRRGRVVVIDRAAVDAPAHVDPGEGLFLKHVVAAPGDRIPAPFDTLPTFLGEEKVPHGCYLVLGRHPASVDSKQWGYVRADAVSGVVITRIG
ncbi:S26 family signal peptidase [Streptomyces sp. PvR034]|uniref:S26 family signal peptidase n=1 Tax=Streptomyces sp. PvR034 TaxID=3156401 RepID=UPI003393BA80